MISFDFKYNWTNPFVFLLLFKLCLTMADDCHPEELSQCIPEMHGFLDKNGKLFAVTEEELDDMCKTLNREMDCLEKYVKRCFQPKSHVIYDRMLANSMKVIDDLCKTGEYRTKYLSSAHCLNESSVNLNFCVDSYRLLVKESFRGIDSVTLENTEDVNLIRFCCAYAAFIACINDNILQFCDSSTVAFYEDFLYRSTTSVFQGRCSNFTVGSMWCQSLNKIIMDMSPIKEVILFAVILVLSAKWQF